MIEIGMLTGSTVESGDSFGSAVSVSGQTIVVGANDDNTSGGEEAGSVYIFEVDENDPNGWTEVKQVFAGDGSAGDQFGHSVDIDGDTLVVGAYADNSYTGAIYIFERDAGGPDNWGQVAKRTASDAQTFSRFGLSVSIDGDLIIVGAYLSNNTNGTDAGSAYIFGRNQGGSQNWGQIIRLIASNGFPDSYYGYGVDISGSTAIVGAYDETGDTPGAAYIYEQDFGGANTWGEAAILTGSGGEPDDRFGIAVTVNGDTVAVGAITHFDMGVVYIFERDLGGPDSWGERKFVQPDDPALGDGFGRAVELDGDRLLAASVFDEDQGPNSGSMTLFGRDQWGSNQWGVVAKILPSKGIDFADFGWDLDIDGILIIGGQTEGERAFLFEISGEVIFLPLIAR